MILAIFANPIFTKTIFGVENMKDFTIIILEMEGNCFQLAIVTMITMIVMEMDFVSMVNVFACNRTTAAAGEASIVPKSTRIE
jgi:hypothetical protein